MGSLLEGGLHLIGQFVQCLQFRFIKVLTTVVIMIIALHRFYKVDLVEVFLIRVRAASY